MVTDVRSETAVTKAYRLSVNPDVDILLRRADLPRAIEAMQAGGFFYHQTFGVDMFLDGPDTKPSEAVQVIFAHEKVKESDLHLTPDVDDSEQGKFSVLSLEALVPHGPLLTVSPEPFHALTQIKRRCPVGLSNRRAPLAVAGIIS